MAYAMFLVEKNSGLNNIVHNYERNQQQGTEDASLQPMKKGKSVTKSNMKEIKEAHLVNFLYFCELRGGSKTSTMEQRQETMKRFEAWEAKVGVFKTRNDQRTAAQKRLSIEPLVGNLEKRRNITQEDERIASMLSMVDNEYDWDTVKEQENETFYYSLTTAII
jgi:hypothetical protein